MNGGVMEYQTDPRRTKPQQLYKQLRRAHEHPRGTSYVEFWAVRADDPSSTPGLRQFTLKPKHIDISPQITNRSDEPFSARVRTEDPQGRTVILVFPNEAIEGDLDRIKFEVLQAE